jgi:hypothetical protein
MILTKVNFVSAKMAADRRTTAQSLTTPVTRAVKALVRDITRKTERFRTKVHMQFKKSVRGGKFQEALESILGFSRNIHGTNRHSALHHIKNENSYQKNNI